MNWIAIIILAGVFLAVFIPFMKANVFDGYTTVGEGIPIGLIGALLSGLESVFVFLLPFAASEPQNTSIYKPVETHTGILVQAQVTDKTEGYHGLFYGRIDDRDVYRFYVKTSDGYRMDYLYADNSRIVETKDTPKVVYYDRIKYLNNDPNWWQRNFFTKDAWENLCTENCKHMGVIYVPEGTIIKNKFDNLNL